MWALLPVNTVDRICLTTSPKASATSDFLYGSLSPALESMELCGVVLLENRPLMVISPPILYCMGVYSNSFTNFRLCWTSFNWLSTSSSDSHSESTFFSSWFWLGCSEAFSL